MSRIFSYEKQILQNRVKVGAVMGLFVGVGGRRPLRVFVLVASWRNSCLVSLCKYVHEGTCCVIARWDGPCLRLCPAKRPRTSYSLAIIVIVARYYIPRLDLTTEYNNFIKLAHFCIFVLFVMITTLCCTKTIVRCFKKWQLAMSNFQKLAKILKHFSIWTTLGK